MRTDSVGIRTLGRHGLAPICIAVALVATACGGDDSASDAPGSSSGTPVVVVTYSILGDVVQRLVGDAAEVQVVIPNGQDPHEFSPSARDVESMRRSALIVANGLDLEEGLADALGEAEDDGVPVFHVTDHVTLRTLSEDEAALEDAAHAEADQAGAEADHDHDEAAHDEAGHDHGGEDPHVWTDPLLMREMAPALVDQLEAVLGVQLDDRLTAFVADMDDLDASVDEIMGAVPAGECRLVTGHESLGYFAQRYGCEIIGAVIPSLSSTAEASAKDLADLAAAAEAAGVAAIFTEVGTPAQVAEQVSSAVGVPLVELPSHQLPDSGGYDAYITDLATKIATALAA
jgi:zinc/manganese transport system substrate-binding protein